MTSPAGAGPDDPGTVRRQLAERSGTRAEDWHLVFKARYGMEIVFRALAELRGSGDVATQAFTCATAIDPILVAGLHPVYGDVSPDSVALDPERLTVSDRTRAVVVQNTFGILDEARARRLREAADAAGAVLVEDSAHCVTRLARDADGAPLADVSIHSFGVEKMLPTRFGGAVWINPAMPDDALRRRIGDVLSRLPQIGRRIDLNARLYRTQNRIINRLPRGLARVVRDAMTRLGTVEPAIVPAELRGTLPYPPMKPSARMAVEIGSRLPELDRIERERRAVVAEYLRALAGVVEVPAAIDEKSALVRFPLFVAEPRLAEDVIAAVDAGGFYAGRWYRPALFPGVSDPEAYEYAPGKGLSTTEDLIDRVVNLPTRVSVDQARRIAAIVRDAVGADR